MKPGIASVILILGLANLVLLSFQLSTGLRWVKVPFGTHRKIGLALFATALLHGLLGLLAQL